MAMLGITSNTTYSRLLHRAQIKSGVTAEQIEAMRAAMGYDPARARRGKKPKKSDEKNNAL